MTAPPSEASEAGGAPPLGGDTLVIGLLGGIASGKSEVARRLAGRDGLVLAADAIAHEVLASEEVRGLVERHFGPGVLGPDGRPDREALARCVFTGPPEATAEARRKLEDWIHPRVRARILGALRDARSSGVPRVVLDVPLLLENEAQHGLTALCDALVFVDADAGERERRAGLSRGWPPGEVARREAAQAPLDEKRARSDYVVSNRADLEALDREVRSVLQQLEEDRESEKPRTPLP